MNKSIKQQYIDLREGRMTQQNFMRNLRMTLPQYITNVTSYNDSIKILKNKGILTEADIKLTESHPGTENWIEAFKDDLYKRNLTPEEKEKAEKALQFIDIVDMYGMFQHPFAVNAFLSDVDAILKQSGVQENKEETPATKRFFDKMSSEMNKFSKPVSDKRKKELEDKIKKQREEREKASLKEVIIPKKGKKYTWTMGAEMMPITYIGTRSENPNVKVGSSVGKGHIFQFEDGSYIEVGPQTIMKYVEADNVDLYPGNMGDEMSAPMEGKLNEAKDEKGKWTNANGKSMYDQFKEIDNLNGQEVLIGIDYEIEKNHQLTKVEAAKIVIKNLKKNPLYYTSALISGKEGYEPEYLGGKSAQPEARQMQPYTTDKVVDKKMGMQPVKGIEKPKKDADAKKETNKIEKGVDLMTLVAQAERGVQKMAATGEKMKKITVREGNLGHNEISSIEPEGRFWIVTYRTADGTKEKTFQSEDEARKFASTLDKAKTIQESVDKALAKERLKEMIREEMKEIFDGRANMSYGMLGTKYDETGENK